MINIARVMSFLAVKNGQKKGKNARFLAFFHHFY